MTHIFSSCTYRPFLKFLGLFFMLLLFSLDVTAQQLTLTSPDKSTEINIYTGKKLSFSIKKNGESILDESTIDIEIDGKSMVESHGFRSSKAKTVNTSFNPVLPLKNATVQDNYNELTLKFRGGFNVEFRAYDEGVAYRFTTTMGREVQVGKEKMDLSFPQGTYSLFPLEESTYSHNERSYINTNLDTLAAGKFASLPVFFKEDNGTHILFSEADVYDYPQLFIEKSSNGTLSAKHPRAVAQVKPQPGEGGDRNQDIVKEHPYIALTQGKRSFPWRFFVIAKDDGTFLEQDMVLKLSRKQKIDDTSWIKPGKIAWDWWNANNLYNVDFKAGLNTETYKYYIDFAAKNGLEYVILDEGWTKSTTEILEFNPDIDVQELIRYGKEKNVGIILWCLWKPLDDNMQKILDTYASWGAVGIKVDFMQRSDQYMTNSYEKIARACADRKLIVDFHGAFKPSGLRRAYPNVVSFEGVKGNEFNKWSTDVTPQHNTNLPFIRNAVGPMDYTPGGMHNVSAINFLASKERPMTMGTRAHQVALYTVFTSTIQMLCDSPSAYIKEQETTDFIAQIPTTWDETHALDAQVGEYLAVAKRNGNTWYVGAITNWDPRMIEIDLSFLPAGKYKTQVYGDGINADRYAQDYHMKQIDVDNTTTLNAQLAPGGGWSAIITPVE